MNFFEAQSAAKRRSGLLVVLFGAAIVAIILVVYAAAWTAVGAPGGRVFDPGLFVVVAFGVGLLVGAGSLFRTAQLRRGGPAVAELLGGRRVSADTADPAERRLMNVVEEMAIASGTPVPAVYVMDHEDSINAFAAGHSPRDAAVAVTRGTLNLLNRDELQGVMAHEFSHILNGDMRLNVRLMGLLFGILLLAVIGRGFLHGGRFGARRQQGGQIALVGLALILVGYIGVLFGRLIKAAVSRQREYLADAAAVQFTRNPDGIAGALRKIGGWRPGSRIREHHAEELSHLFFANGLVRPLSRLTATHPPLADRIRRVDPAWDGRYPEPEPVEPVDDEAAAGTRREAPGPGQAARRPGFPGMPGPRDAAAGGAAGADMARSAAVIALPAAILATIGAPRPEHVEHAGKLLRSLPPELPEAAHALPGAEALVFAMLLSDRAGVAEAQRNVVRGYGGDELVQRVDGLAPAVRAAGPAARLPLVDLAIPALRNLPPDRSIAFRWAVGELVRADGQRTVFDFALVHMLRRQLTPDEDQPEAKRMLRTMAPIRDQVGIVLSAMARSGADDEAAAAAAFQAAAARLDATTSPLKLLSPDATGLDAVDAALGRIEQGSLDVRRRFLDACAHAVAHDNEVRTTEAELLRAIAEALDCPMPPVLGGTGAT